MRDSETKGDRGKSGKAREREREREGAADTEKKEDRERAVSWRLFGQLQLIRFLCLVALDSDGLHCHQRP